MKFRYCFLKKCSFCKVWFFWYLVDVDFLVASSKVKTFLVDLVLFWMLIFADWLQILCFNWSRLRMHLPPIPFALRLSWQCGNFCWLLWEYLYLLHNINFLWTCQLFTKYWGIDVLYYSLIFFPVLSVQLIFFSQWVMYTGILETLLVCLICMFVSSCESHWIF